MDRATPQDWRRATRDRAAANGALLARLVRSVGKRMARRDDGDYHQETWQISECLLRPRRTLPGILSVEGRAQSTLGNNVGLSCVNTGTQSFN